VAAPTGDSPASEISARGSLLLCAGIASRQQPLLILLPRVLLDVVQEAVSDGLGGQRLGVLRALLRLESGVERRRDLRHAAGEGRGGWWERAEAIGRQTPLHHRCAPLSQFIVMRSAFRRKHDNRLRTAQHPSVAAAKSFSCKGRCGAHGAEQEGALCGPKVPVFLAKFCQLACFSAPFPGSNYCFLSQYGKLATRNARTSP
jgi:hypothetical protein